MPVEKICSPLSNRFSLGKLYLKQHLDNNGLNISEFYTFGYKSIKRKQHEFHRANGFFEMPESTEFVDPINEIFREYKYENKNHAKLLLDAKRKTSKINSARKNGYLISDETDLISTRIEIGVMKNPYAFIRKIWANGGREIILHCTQAAEDVVVSTSELSFALPENGVQRTKFFEQAAKLSIEQGLEPVFDDGEELICFAFD